MHPTSQSHKYVMNCIDINRVMGDSNRVLIGYCVVLIIAYCV